MAANIKLELKTLTPGRLLALLTRVASQMDGDPTFPHPPIPMATLKAKAKVLEVAIEEATHGSRQSKLVRNDHVKKVKDMLRTTAAYVRMVAGTDKTLLEKSGFQLAKEPKPIGRVGTPVLQASKMTGRPGVVTLRWSGVHGRNAYNVYVTDQDPGSVDVEWILTGVTGKVTHNVDNLESFKTYWFSVSAVGSAGEGVKSDPALGCAA